MPEQALSCLHLCHGYFPQVTVTSRRAAPKTSAAKPSVAAILFILVAAGGPMSVSTAENTRIKLSERHSVKVTLLCPQLTRRPGPSQELRGFDLDRRHQVGGKLLERLKENKTK
jgi:hypothetical protein